MDLKLIESLLGEKCPKGYKPREEDISIEGLTVDVIEMLKEVNSEFTGKTYLFDDGWEEYSQIVMVGWVKMTPDEIQKENKKVKMQIQKKKEQKDKERQARLVQLKKLHKEFTGKDLEI